MRSRILNAYPDSEFGTVESDKIFVADFSIRTDNARRVEIHAFQPKDPNDATKEMDCCVIDNNTELRIDYTVFKDNQFKNEENKDLKHGECCLFPNQNNDNTWMLFIEIKDCKGSRISYYKQDVKEKLIINVGEFRKKGILLKNNVYGVASFPRKKTEFNEMIVTDPVEYKTFYKKYGFHLVPTNWVSIKDSTIIDFYKKK